MEARHPAGPAPNGPTALAERAAKLARLMILLHRSSATLEAGWDEAVGEISSVPAAPEERTAVPGARPVPDPFPGEYRLVERIAGGAHGEVWLAQHVTLPWKVAVKTSLPGTRDGDRERNAQALLCEVQALIALRHPHVVRVLAWKRVEGTDYMVMEYIDGRSFKERLLEQPEGRFDWSAATRYACDIGDGLRESHRCGLVHRDVKPANVLWDKYRDEALLADFGIALRSVADRSSAGTPLYMAPEVFAGVNSPAQDVYSLAATLFQLITGEVPFTGALYELPILATQGLSPTDRRFAVVPEPVERLIRAGLEPDPNRRIPLEKFVTGLRGALNGTLGTALAAGARAAGPAPLRVRVLRRDPTTEAWVEVATTPTHVAPRSRDIKRVPPPPPVALLRTNDSATLEVTVARAGALTVFNIGPTGNLNLLYPERPDPAALGEPVAAGQVVTIDGLTVTPPDGRERLVAVWSEKPLPVPPEALRSVTDADALGDQRPAVATRDVERVREEVARLPASGWYAVALELDHAPEVRP